MESNDADPSRSISPLHVTVLVTVRLAHNLRNLLMIMGQCADSMRRHAPREPRLDDDLTELDRTLDRAFHVTHELLAIGHPSAREPVVVDVNQLVTDARGMIERALGDGMSLRLRLEARKPHVLADPYELEWLLLNLAMNGRDAMRQEGVLTIETGDCARPLHEGGYPLSFVRLTVRDAGHVVHPRAQDRVPWRLFTISDGADLRLANAAMTVERLDGRLHVDREEGVGTSVHVDLPAGDLADEQ